MATLTLQPVSGQDVYTYEYDPTANYYSLDKLVIGYNTGTGKRLRGLIKFDISSLPTGAVITSAVIGLYCTYVNGGTNYLIMGALGTNWDAASVTWNTSPVVPSSGFNSTSISSSGVWLTNDVTSRYQAILAGSSDYGFGIMSSDESQALKEYASSRNSDSTIRPKLTIVYDMPPTAPTVTYPNGGENFETTHTVTWNAATDTETAQASLQYNVVLSTDGGATYPTTLIALTSAGVTSLAYDFSSVTASDNCLIAVRAYDGTAYGAWDYSDAVFTIRHNIAPTAPTGLTCPSFDATLAQVMSWTFNDPNSWDSQSAYQIKVIRVSDSAVVKDTGKITSAISSYVLPANTCVNGVQYQWEVACWDSYNVSGPYSYLATFYASAPPVATIDSPATDGYVLTGSVLNPEWTYSDPASNAQQSYQLIVTTPLDVVLWDSGQVVSSIARGALVTYNLPNLSSFKIKLTVWNSMGIASSQVVRTLSTNFITPAVPEVSITTAIEHIVLNIVNPAPTGSEPPVDFNDIYRRTKDSLWIRIAQNVPANTNYTDYAMASNQSYDYKVRALGTTTATSDSLIITTLVTLHGIWMYVIYDPSGTMLNILCNTNRAENWTPEVQFMKFAGRVNAVSEFGESEDSNFTVDLRMKLSSITWASLRSLARMKATLCVRDYRGRKVFGVIAKLPEVDDNYGQTVTLEIIQVDYTEAV